MRLSGRSKGKKRQSLCLIILKAKDRTPWKKSQKLMQSFFKSSFITNTSRNELKAQLSVIVFKCIWMTHHLSGLHKEKQKNENLDKSQRQSLSTRTYANHWRARVNETLFFLSRGPWFIGIIDKSMKCQNVEKMERCVLWEHRGEVLFWIQEM